MEALKWILTGAVGGAVIKLIDNVIQWYLNRKAQVEDAEAKEDDETDQRLKSIEIGLRVLLLDRIQELGYRYLKDGEIRMDERHNLHVMHDAYHDTLHGNGDADSIMNLVDELPLK